MNYDLIKILCTRRGISMNKLSHQIGYSEPGFYRMIKEKSIKVEILEKISAALKVNPGVFFKDLAANDNEVNEPAIEYKPAPPDNIAELIELQRFKIKALEAQIAELKNKQ